MAHQKSAKSINEPNLLSRIEKTSLEFKKIYKSKHDVIVRSPGRAEIIGNHTDYNEGYALAGCISQSILAFSRKRLDNQVNVHSKMFGETNSFQISGNIKKDNIERWSNYARGVVQNLVNNNYDIGGADILIDSTIPATGVSSSAAFELAIAFTLCGLYNQEIALEKISTLCKEAENKYVGTPCGFLDQGAITFGKKDNLILFDFLPKGILPVSKIDLINIDLSKENASFILISDKDVKHELGNSGYPARRKMCEDSLAFWEKKLGIKVPSLRYVTCDDFEKYKSELKEINPTMKKRVEHVIYENKRVLTFVELIKINRIKEAGEILTKSGESALKLYELDEKTPELTFLFNQGHKIKGNLGFRNMGGGFNATALALVKNDYLSYFQEKLNNLYKSKFKRDLTFVKFNITDGIKFIY